MYWFSCHSLGSSWKDKRRCAPTTAALAVSHFSWTWSSTYRRIPVLSASSISRIFELTEANNCSVKELSSCDGITEVDSDRERLGFSGVSEALDWECLRACKRGEGGFRVITCDLRGRAVVIVVNADVDICEWEGLLKEKKERRIKKKIGFDTKLNCECFIFFGCQINFGAKCSNHQDFPQFRCLPLPSRSLTILGAAYAGRQAGSFAVNTPLSQSPTCLA